MINRKFSMGDSPLANRCVLSFSGISRVPARIASERSVGNKEKTFRLIAH